MDKTASLDSVDLLARACAYIRLARSFVYPTEAMLEDLRSGGFLDALSQATGVVDEQGTLAVALNRLAESVAHLCEGQPGLREEHTHLFARQSPAPPYETSYGPNSAFGGVAGLGEVAGYYAAFGLKIAPDNPDLPSHVGAELEFVGVLCAKEAYAKEAGMVEERAICQAARRRFVSEHLGCWLPRFVERLEAKGRLSFYPAVGALALALVQGEPTAEPTGVSDVSSESIGTTVPRSRHADPVEPRRAASPPAPSSVYGYLDSEDDVFTCSVGSVRLDDLTE